MDRNQFIDPIPHSHEMSLSARRAWIEISRPSCFLGRLWSLSARRAWIEILGKAQRIPGRSVALRKESVDRNAVIVCQHQAHAVALRKESVDRNANPGSTTLTFPGSLSARRAWIEIVSQVYANFSGFCRSPQGERG